MNTNTGTKLLAALIVGLSAVAISGSAGAAPLTHAGNAPHNSPGGGQWQNGAKNGGHGPDHRLQRMAQELNLTAAQKARIKPLLDQSMAQHRALKNNTSLTPDQKKARMMQIRRQTQSRLNAILTPAQRQKLAAMRQQRRNQFKGGKGGPPGGHPGNNSRPHPHS